MPKQKVPDPLTQAVLITSRGIFEDWESVWVQHRWAESTPQFRFTAVEREPIPNLWDKLQFRPGDWVNITLGGQLALQNGLIVSRQVAYDANQHGVQLEGKSLTYFAAKSSVDHPDGNFDGMTFEQVAHAVLDKYQGMSIATIGTLNPRVFQYLQNEKGETNWDFLERIARVRGIVLGSDHLGHFLLIGNHTYPVVANLVEGVNILSCQCVIQIEDLRGYYEVVSQGAGTDGNSGTAVSEPHGDAPGTGPATSKVITPSPVPVTGQDELTEMAQNEAVWSEGTYVQATITSQGWMMPGAKELWRAGTNVFVNSPMAILDQVMKIRTVTFSQDQRGTLTTLDLVVPWLLKDAIPLVDENWQGLVNPETVTIHGPAPQQQPQKTTPSLPETPVPNPKTPNAAERRGVRVALS
jgi:prophage tail gpP-like protein